MPSIQFEIPGVLGMADSLPRAARLQLSVSDADSRLTSLARERGRLVAWWWGVRKIDGVMCAYCYVCDTVIVTGSLNVAISVGAQNVIEEHRTSHWSDVDKDRRRHS